MFKVEYISGGRAWAYCLYHDDTHRPNVSITLDGKWCGRWRCWACGKKGKLTDKQMGELNVEPFKEYKIFNTNYATCWRKLVASYVKNLDRFPLLREGLMHELNVSRESLFEWDIGYDGTAFTIPMYTNYVLSGIQRRFPNGKKCCVQGSKLGIILAAYQFYSPEEPLFICEGFTDAISVCDLGFNAIARPHCHFIDGIIEYLNAIEYAWDNIIIVPDNDVVGTEGAKNLHKSIIRNVEHLHIDTFNFSGAKDIREYIAKKGKDKVRKELTGYL